MGEEACGGGSGMNVVVRCEVFGEGAYGGGSGRNVAVRCG